MSHFLLTITVFSMVLPLPAQQNAAAESTAQAIAQAQAENQRVENARLSVTTFTVRSVNLRGDDCSLSVKSADGVTYYASAWAWMCGNIRTGDSLTGHVKINKSAFSPTTTYLYFRNGETKMETMKWSRPFVVSSQSK